MQKGIIIIISILLFGCSKEPVESNNPTDFPTSIGYLFFKEFLVDYNNEPDAFVNIDVKHFFQSESSSSNTEMRVRTASFMDADGQGGIIKLDPFGEVVLKNGVISSFSEVLSCCDDLPETGVYSLDFVSDNDEYSSFEQEINIDFQHVVTSNFEFDPATSYFLLDPNVDLELTWTGAIEGEKVYIYICTNDVPCIKKEVNDTGTLIIDKSEFAAFPSSNTLIVYFMKIDQNCFTLKGEEVCINVTNYSRPGPIRVK